MQWEIINFRQKKINYLLEVLLNLTTRPLLELGLETLRNEWIKFSNSINIKVKNFDPVPSHWRGRLFDGAITSQQNDWIL